MYKDSKNTCTAIVLLIKLFVWRRSRCRRRRVLLKLPIRDLNEDGKARTGTAVDAGNFRGSRRVAKNKMLKMCIFAKDGDVKNSNFEKRFLRSNDIL